MYKSINPDSKTSNNFAHIIHNSVFFIVTTVCLFFLNGCAILFDNFNAEARDTIASPPIGKKKKAILAEKPKQNTNLHNIDDAVYPLQNSTTAILTFDAKSGMSISDVATLADRFEVEFINSGKHTVVNRAKMKEILDLQKFSIECGSADCAVEAGQILGVEYIVYGSIGFIGKTYTINSYITDVERGKTIASAALDYTGSIDEFLKHGIEQSVNKLLYSVTQAQITH